MRVDGPGQAADGGGRGAHAERAEEHHDRRNASNTEDQVGEAVASGVHAVQHVVEREAGRDERPEKETRRINREESRGAVQGARGRHDPQAVVFHEARAEIREVHRGDECRADRGDHKLELT